MCYKISIFRFYVEALKKISHGYLQWHNHHARFLSDTPVSHIYLTKNIFIIP